MSCRRRLSTPAGAVPGLQRLDLASGGQAFLRLGEHRSGLRRRCGDSMGQPNPSTVPGHLAQSGQEFGHDRRCFFPQDGWLLPAGRVALGCRITRDRTARSDTSGTDRTTDWKNRAVPRTARCIGRSGVRRVEFKAGSDPTRGAGLAAWRLGGLASSRLAARVDVHFRPWAGVVRAPPGEHGRCAVQSNGGRHQRLRIDASVGERGDRCGHRG